MEQRTSPGNKSSLSKKLLGIIAVLGVVCVALAAATALLYQRLSESNAQIQELFTNQHSIQEQLQSYTQGQSAYNTEVAEKVNSLGSEIENIKDSLSITQEQIAEIGQREEAVVNSNYVLQYEVHEDDTLQSICEENDLNYEEKALQILELNGLEDESEIVPGQIILIPLS